MTGGYVDVLRTEGAARAFVPALFGRLSFAMVGLVLLLTIEGATDSFAIAGSATGAFGIVNVLVSPYRARSVDRFGQFRTLNFLAVAFALVLAGTALIVDNPDTPAWLVILAAAAVGLFPPPLGASMRVLWSELTPENRVRTKAYSIDAVSEELLFTIGPLVAVAAVSVGPAITGPLVVGAASILGTFGMTTSPASRRHVAVVVQDSATRMGRSVPGEQDSATHVAGPVQRTRASAPLRQRGFGAVLVALAGVGFVLGSIEITVPATADGHSIGI